ncbi:hypothetical protein ACFCWB_20670 [Streptomyces bacillaris]|uniref:hypothetical protein n=1 Tax=Streptomyces bacillaris TaxID=68179 RepID=UPI0035DC32DF
MISLQIPAANALVFIISLVVGCVVYRRSVNHAGSVTKGDLAMAIAATAACVVVLAFLFGLGDGAATPAVPGVSPTP